MRTKRNLQLTLKGLDKEKEELTRLLLKDKCEITQEVAKERLIEVSLERQDFIQSLSEEEKVLLKLHKY